MTFNQEVTREHQICGELYLAVSRHGVTTYFWRELPTRSTREVTGNSLITHYLAQPTFYAAPSYAATSFLRKVRLRQTTHPPILIPQCTSYRNAGKSAFLPFQVYSPSRGEANSPKLEVKGLAYLLFTLRNESWNSAYDVGVIKQKLTGRKGLSHGRNRKSNRRPRAPETLNYITRALGLASSVKKQNN